MSHAQSGRFFEGTTHGNVAVERVVRAGLIGQQVGDDAAARHFGKHFGAVAHQPHRQRALRRHGFMQHFHGVVKRVRDAVAVTALDAALDALRIHLDAQKRRAIHGGGEWLRTPHAAHAAGDDQPAR